MQKPIPDMKDAKGNTTWLITSALSDIAKALVLPAILALVVWYAFANKENLFWSEFHKDLATGCRVTYEDYGKEGLMFGLSSARAELAK